MADPLSIAASIAGLLGTSATVLSILYDLYKHAKDAADSLNRVIGEVEEMNAIFGQVQRFISGVARADHGRLTMLSLHDLVATLSGCVFVCETLHRYVREVADIMDHTNKVKLVLERIRWAAWKESEVAGFIEDLQRHKMSLNLMLTIIQW
jgi:cell division control protein 24